MVYFHKGLICKKVITKRGPIICRLKKSYIICQRFCQFMLMELNHYIYYEMGVEYKSCTFHKIYDPVDDITSCFYSDNI